LEFNLELNLEAVLEGGGWGATERERGEADTASAYNIAGDRWAANAAA
jgi:hypothetical protein